MVAMRVKKKPPSIRTNGDELLKEETTLWVTIGGVMISDELMNAGIFVDVVTIHMGRI